MATQNPIEQEGTYPLPEAQLDRFLFELLIDYPGAEEEEEIARATTSGSRAEVQSVLGAEELVAAQQLVRRVPVADHLIKYAVKIVRASRPGDTASPEYVREMVSWGAGPRASQYIVLASKARAVLDGRHSVSAEDIRAVAPAVLRHRLVVNYQAEAQNVNASALIAAPLTGLCVRVNHSDAVPSYLDPETLSRVARLDLVARLVVEGFITGLHRSPYHGFSVEFSEHRAYMPGDPLRDLDWKAYAKSDRLYVKQYEEETNLKAYILCDVSGSMDFLCWCTHE